MTYLDYAAHTPISKQAMGVLTQALQKASANDQSVHRRGVALKKDILQAKKAIRETVSARADDIVSVMGGGTEANIASLTSLCEGIEKGKMLITSIEHDSVRSFARKKVEEGWTVLELPVSDRGVVDIKTAELILNKFKPDVFSCIYVNNEVGTEQPVRTLAQKARAAHPLVRIHCDAAQAPLYLPINISSLEVDVLTLCGQKLYGPQGVAIAVGDKKFLDLIQVGTTPYALFMSFTTAFVEAQNNIAMYSAEMKSLQKELFSNFDKEGIDFLRHGEGLPLALSVSFPGLNYDSEYLVSYCSEHDFYLSSKSACLGSKTRSSYVLDAMGVKEKNTLRISLGSALRKKDLKLFAKTLAQLK